jgi:hypothetical protein
MRTISGTVRTREEAEAARRRLEALGIEGDRILFKEVEGPDAGIFVTVKAAPEQVAAATRILKGGGAQARRPESEPPQPARPQPAQPVQPQAFERPRIDPAPSPPPIPRGERAAVERTERVEHWAPGSEPHTRAAPPKDRQPASVNMARMAAFAALLAGLGFAAGAALGILF